MSVFADIDDVSSLTTEAIHADSVTLKDGDGNVLNPLGVTVYGYAQELTSDPFSSVRSARAFLHIANDEFTHVIHIRRSELIGVTLKNINTITVSGKEYRFTHFTDQPTRAEVELFCKLT